MRIAWRTPPSGAVERVVGARPTCVHDAFPGAPMAVCGLSFRRRATAREVSRLRVCRRCRGYRV